MNTKLQLCIMLLTFILFSNLLFAQDAQNIDPLNPCGFSKTVDQATLERKLKILQEVGNKSIEDNNCQASILIKLAKINANNLQIEVALSNYNKAFKILDSLHNNDLLRLLTSNRGDMLLNLGDLKASRKDFKASLHYIKESEYKQRKSIAYINISATFDKNQGDSIIYYANKAVDTYQDTDNVRLRVNIYNNLSWGYLLNNQPEKALSILEKNVDRSILSKEVLGLLYPAVMHTMGKIYYELGLYKKAISSFDVALNEIENSRKYVKIITILNDRALSYEKLNLFEKSIKDLKQVTQFNKVIDSINISREIAKFEYNKLLSSREQTINNLEKINTINISKLNKNKSIIYILLFIFSLLGIAFIVKQNRQKINLFKIKEQLYLVRLNALRNIMNPHFLFNAFSTLQNFILKKEYVVANDYMTELSQIIRNVMVTYDALYTELSKEISILKSYLNLERQRLKHNFEWRFEIPTTLENKSLYIPSMVIQPFIENAIIHAFSNKSSEKLIIIKFKKEGDYLIIEIIDNGLGRTFLEESKKANESHKNLNSATKNIEERLALLEKLTKKKHNITIVDLFDDKQNSAGTKVIITLPTLDNYE